MTRAQGQKLLAGSRKKRGRYTVRAKSERTVDGIVFRSAAEALRYAKLKNAERAGEIFDLRKGKARDLVVNGKKVGQYTPDFEYLTKTGLPIIEEVKSGRTGEETDYRLRRKLFEACYGCEVKEVIQLLPRRRK